MSRAIKAFDNSIEILNKIDHEALIKEISTEKEQRCHCGNIQLVASTEKTFKCKECGYDNDKEKNASRIIEDYPQLTYADAFTDEFRLIITWHPEPYGISCTLPDNWLDPDNPLRKLAKKPGEKPK
jgi:hypothetical protein